MTLEEFSNILKGNIDIPFLKERYNTVVSISKIVNIKMNGNFYDYIKNINNDIELFDIIINNFKDLCDERKYNNRKVYFYKLAQLLTFFSLYIYKRVHINF